MSARVVVVTGTDTEVGKTVVTAALCARLLSSGQRVHLHKPTQTGVGPHDEGDVQTVERLLGRPAGLSTSEGVRLPEPLAPATAARRAGVCPPTVVEHAQQVRALASAPAVDVVVVEGAGGLLVEVDEEGATLRDLVGHLVADLGTAAVQLVVVARAGLGTLNHAALTVEALKGLPPGVLAGLVVGAASSSPGLAEQCNVQDLPRVTGLPLLGALPEGSGSLDSDRFVAQASGGLGWP